MQLEAAEASLHSWLGKNMISVEGEYDLALEMLIHDHDGEELVELLEKEGE